MYCQCFGSVSSFNAAAATNLIIKTKDGEITLREKGVSYPNDLRRFSTALAMTAIIAVVYIRKLGTKGADASVELDKSTCMIGTVY